MDQKPWLKKTLTLTAIHNLVWGGWVVLFPFAIFDLLRIERPHYPQIWQCVGMIVGVYGIGYAIAAKDYARHWPIVFVGFLGKVFGPIGFFQSAFIDQTFPPSFFMIIVFNDLIWWIPFFLILKESLHHDAQLSHSKIQSPEALLQSRDWTDADRRLLVFLRHMGCTFCREVLVDLAKIDFSELKVRLVFVTMSAEADARGLIAHYHFKNFELISDPDRSWYRSFGLKRASWGKSFHPRIWVKAVKVMLGKRVGIGPLDGDGFQLGGAFLVRFGRIERAYRSKDVADNPSWKDFLG